MIGVNTKGFSSRYASLITMLLMGNIFLSINIKLGEIEFLSLHLINVFSLVSLFLLFFLTAGFRNVKINRVQLSFIAFLIYAWANSYFNPTSDGLNFTPFFLLVRFITLIILIGMIPKPSLVIRYIIYSVFFVVLIAMFELMAGHTVFASSWQNGERYNELGLLVIGSTIASSNHLSLTLLFSLPLIQYYMMINPTRIFFKLVFAAVMMILFFTFSRTGLLLGCIMIALLLLRDSIKPRALIYGFLFICAGIIAYHLFLLSNLSSLEAFVFDSSESDNSVRYRGYVLIVLLQTFLQNPIFGLGSVGSFKRSSVDIFSGQSFFRSEIDTSPMNTYLGTLTELGATGLLMFLIVVFGMIKISLRYYADRRSLFHYNMLIILLIYLINIVVIDASTFPFFIIVLSLISVFYKKDEIIKKCY